MAASKNLPCEDSTISWNYLQGGFYVREGDKLTRKKFVALNERISSIRIGGGHAVVAPKQTIWYFPVMVDYSLLSDPIERGYKFRLSIEVLT